MPTIFSHPAVALIGMPGLTHIRKKTGIIITGMLLTILPDVDVIAFIFGIPYYHALGHRGFSHSILFSLIAATIIIPIFKQDYKLKTLGVWLYLAVCSLSHGLLDAITSGGLGVGFLIPFSNTRYFFEYRPIKVSTLNIGRFFNGQGLPVLQTEIVVIWMPILVIIVILTGMNLFRKYLRNK